MNKKILMAAGLLVAGGLVGFQFYAGNLKAPAAVTSLWAKAEPGPMKKDFPSQTGSASDLMTAHPAPPDTPPDSLPEGATVDGAAPAGLGDEEVNARIGLAMELSKALVASNGATAAAPGAATSQAPGATSMAPAPYAGAWSGHFFGPDAGTIVIEIDESGAVRGEGVSTITGIGFSLSGKVASTGKFELVQSTSGATSTGATFSGALTKAGTASGTWAMAAYNVAGTFEMKVSAP